MQAAAHSEIAPQYSRGSRLGVLTLCLLCFATWALVHGYQGIFHDAILYTLQALARLDPGALSQDVFLRFGSQDRFTIFSPLYAAAAQWLGAERAAAALTLAFQLALFAGAWALARSVMPRGLALLGVLVLIAVPGYYGPDRVFSCVESFLTPRMAAEALALGGIAAALCERRPRAAHRRRGVDPPHHGRRGDCRLAGFVCGDPIPAMGADIHARDRCRSDGGGICDARRQRLGPVR
jgi:hypothetical protein